MTRIGAKGSSASNLKTFIFDFLVYIGGDALNTSTIANNCKDLLLMCQILNFVTC